MELMNPVLPGDGRWVTGEASARASEETGVQLVPMQARLFELLRRLECQESLIRTLQATQVLLNEDSQETAWWTTQTAEPQPQHDDDAWWNGMVTGLVKAGTKAGTIGRMRLGATPRQRTIPRLCQRGMETQNSLMTLRLMFS